ncbi:MAG TPA: ATP synthase F0 subunit B [Candidatus Binataceae bacterium]|nr:ATP synthase F0 subunit B [Candidatus Binataceae bacterium]
MHIPPDWGTFTVLIVSFLVFWFIFNRLFLRPYLLLLETREQRLRELAERTARLMEERENAESRRAAELAALRHEALARREAERRTVEGEAQQMIDRARSAAHESIEAAREAVRQELAAAEGQLKRAGQGLAQELVERLLRRRVESAASN